jgi:hypothetical protein
VIHVGDYLYREVPCPPGRKECAGSPWGDTSATWNADFFSPAEPLLKVAPWVFVRGNHESCARAGEGWFRFLDPHAMPPRCTDSTAPYVVHRDGVDLLVVDSNAADLTQKELDALNKLHTRHAWLLTHHPLWFPQRTARLNPKVMPPSSVELVIVGHQHTFRVFGFDKPRPPEVVAGNSGTQLDLFASGLAGEFKKQGLPLRSICGKEGFGFLTLENHGESHWGIAERDRDGNLDSECGLPKI